MAETTRRAVVPQNIRQGTLTGVAGGTVVFSWWSESKKERRVRGSGGEGNGIDEGKERGRRKSKRIKSEGNQDSWRRKRARRKTWTRRCDRAVEKGGIQKRGSRGLAWHGLRSLLLLGVGSDSSSSSSSFSSFYSPFLPGMLFFDLSPTYMAKCSTLFSKSTQQGIGNDLPKHAIFKSYYATAAWISDGSSSV